MSVVVRMEMPENCLKCPLHEFGGVCLLKVEHTAEEWLNIHKRRPSNCPIVCQLPKGHGRLVDADAMAKDLEFDCELDARGLDDMNIVGHEREHLQFDKDCKQNCMWYLMEQKTIVPAEAERSET